MSNLMGRFKNSFGKSEDRKALLLSDDERLHQREKLMVSEGCPNTCGVIENSKSAAMTHPK